MKNLVLYKDRKSSSAVKHDKGKDWCGEAESWVFLGKKLTRSPTMNEKGLKKNWKICGDC